jgi:hypothetical protein
MGFSENFKEKPFVLSRALARIEGSPLPVKLKGFKSANNKA